MGSVGKLFVLSGPSGVGKSSLRQRVQKRSPELEYSVSHTTRPQRAGETPDKDYHFVSEAAFLSMVKAKEFVEWARIHGHYYGTSRRQLEAHLEKGRDVLLEIDVQGARQVKAHYPQACFVFILPPDCKSLEQRLRQRGTETEEDLQARLQHACLEMGEAPWYDYLIVNDLLEEASEALAAIIRAGRHHTRIVLPRVLSLIQPPEPQK